MSPGHDKTRRILWAFAAAATLMVVAWIVLDNTDQGTLDDQSPSCVSAPGGGSTPLAVGPGSIAIRGPRFAIRAPTDSTSTSRAVPLGSNASFWVAVIRFAPNHSPPC